MLGNLVFIEYLLCMQRVLPRCYQNRQTHPDPSRGWFFRFVSFTLG